MKKILFLSAHTNSITGGNKRFERLASYSNKYYDSMWISIERSDLDKSNKNIVFFNKISLPTYTLRFLFACLINRREIKSLGRFDLIVVFGETPLLSALFLSKYLGVKISIGVRSNLPKLHAISIAGEGWGTKVKKKLFFYIKNNFYKYIYSQADSIVVQTPQAKLDFCNNYKIVNRKVIIQPNDLPKLPKEIKKKVNERVFREKVENILFIGNESRVKGYDVIVKLYSLIASTDTSVRVLTIVGVNGVDNEVNGVKIKYIERVESVYELMFNHDLLIVPSRDDQFPNVILEAMATSLPVIGSEVGGIPYLINNNKYLFRPGCAKSILDCVNYLNIDNNYKELSEYIVERKECFSFNWEEEYLLLLDKFNRDQ